MDNVVIAGVGKYIPSKVVTNDMLSQIVDTNDEWITSRTGIKQRHITTGENTSDIASKAALNALANANIDALDIDLIIVATCTPDMFTPATACIVQKNIGAKNAFAFDLSAACSGFIYGINVAKSIMKQDPYAKMSDVSEAAGFLSVSHFSRTFSEKEGCSPASWRKEQL